MRLWNYLHHHVLVSQTLHRITQSLNYERAYPAPLMGRTNHYACEKKTDCTISATRPVPTTCCSSTAQMQKRG